MGRTLAGIVGGLLVALPATALCALAFGLRGAAWAFPAFWVGGFLIAATARAIRKAWQWLLFTSGTGFLLFTLVDCLLRSRANLAESGTRISAILLIEAALGLTTGLIMLAASVRIGRVPGSSSSRADSFGAARIDDVTLEVARATVRVDTRAARSALNPRLRWAGVGFASILLATLIIILLRDTSPPIAATLVPVPIPEPVTEPVPVPVPVPVLRPQEGAAAPPAAAAELSVTRRPEAAVRRMASNVRRGCMAQQEAARLFVRLARDNPSRGLYEVAVNSEIKRMLKSHPVGARELTLISSFMWGERHRPDPGPQWWSDQYVECERSGYSGRSFVIRGAGY